MGRRERDKTVSACAVSMSKFRFKYYEIKMKMNGTKKVATCYNVNQTVFSERGRECEERNPAQLRASAFRS